MQRKKIAITKVHQNARSIAYLYEMYKILLWIKEKKIKNKTNLYLLDPSVMDVAIAAMMYLGIMSYSVMLRSTEVGTNPARKFYLLCNCVITLQTILVLSW